MTRRRKKKTHRIYAFCVIVLGIAIIILSVMILFRVQKIEVKGNDYCTREEIVHMVQNDKYSVNALYIFGKYMLGKGEVLACLEDVDVSFGAPWIIKIKVTEKPIVGYIKNGKEYICFDKEGLVVYKTTKKPEEIPYVEGIKIENTELYQTLRSGKDRIFEEILETSKELKKYELTTKKIACKDQYIYVYIGKVCVSLGDSVSAEQIAQISPILEKLGNKKGTLHLENYSEESETIAFNKGEYPKEK